MQTQNLRVSDPCPITGMLIDECPLSILTLSTVRSRIIDIQSRWTCVSSGIRWKSCSKFRVSHHSNILAQSIPNQSYRITETPILS